MTAATWIGALTAVLGGMALAAATPPTWGPAAEWLVLAGLMVWFHLASDQRRPCWHSYVFGCVHMAMFSWSVHHVLFAAYALIVGLGGAYYVIATMAVRACGQRFAVLAFAVAVAAAFWLRANMPEICYPHGQPCHSLWQWPTLLHSVLVGGEPLCNGLLALFAAASVQLWRSWRTAASPWPAARRQWLAAVGACIAFTVLGHVVHVPAPQASDQVVIVAIEPGFHPMYEWASLADDRRGSRLRELIEERLLAPTRDQLAARPAPDVVLWPESSLPENVPRADLAAKSARLFAGRWGNATGRVLLGANVVDDALPTPAALLVETPSGRLLAHQEKRHLVPGGEFQPFFGWLPSSIATSLRDWFEAAMFSLPEAAPGAELPPLQTAKGQLFGALLCFDNAFPGPAQAQVRMGAQWLCVLSNEAWYEGGDELSQLMAMTVVRALETCTPIVRCTQDGLSGAVDAYGRITHSLPLAPSPQPGSRILRVSVTPGPGRLPPLAWLRSATGPSSALLLTGLLLHGFVRWARLGRARTASRSAPATGFSGGEQGSGS